ncbi:Biotin carboxylase 1, chloroplastic [Trichinella nelsoni]|uniref:Biotin carboxylase 1, chloroplastic n=1 Tax=Trichinella nelsoni TaxID=6336 RepID=A0A0V0RA87_9BILA|nr:Biotin carboxylase 1, chloroplastic [Trichinella nelsoni]
MDATMPTCKTVSPTPGLFFGKTGEIRSSQCSFMIKEGRGSSPCYMSCR